MLFALTTNANASRRSSLHGDILLEDVTDSFFMPQLLLKYRNLMRIHMGASASQGDGLLIFGNDAMAFGVVAHRGDNVSPAGSAMLSAEGLPGALLNGAVGFPGVSTAISATPSTIVDLLMAMKMGDDAGLGFRLGIANAGTSVSPDGGDTTGVSQTSLNIGAGYSMLGEALRMDLSLNLNIGLGSDSQAGTDFETTANDIRIGLNGRFYLPMEDQVELGIIGGINLGFGGVTTPIGGGNEVSSSEFGLSLVAGAGPVYKLAKARLAAYGFLGFQTGSSDPNTDTDNDSTSTLSITIPGVHMAMEVDVTDWFRFRGGLEYAWQIASQSDEPGNSVGQNGGSFGWSGGFGLVFDKFTMDFALQNSFFTTGPNFIGGGSGFAASAAAAYSF
ncbi:MAG: hypothetical protein EP329_20320 [Deltaproteobacteria bacterium]|nr:MAG: hypothetical protein EP329_20320 [Deltaproteobacteria bacterium]